MNWEKDYKAKNMKILCQDENCTVIKIEDKTGEGIMTIYSVFDGCCVAYNDFHMEQVYSVFEPTSDIFCVDHCREGRIEWKGKNNSYTYVSAGDMQVDCRENHTNDFFFPLSHYHGLTIAIELQKTDHGVLKLMDDFTVDINKLKEKFCPGESHFIMRAGAQIDRIFSELYDLPEKVRKTYIKIKIMELPIFLMMAIFSFVIFSQQELVHQSAHTLQVMKVALDKLDEIKAAEFIDEDGEEKKLSEFSISFEHVDFGYEKRQILKDVTFTIPQGTTTAIVGPSGSGKTTICKLLARFYDVDAGKITIGGTDIRAMKCDSLLDNISMVFQNVYLFHDTIRNNICFGKSDATEGEMIEAAKKACCHDFIVALPNGYDTVIGEGGGTLSGGERQRISIARAILKNAPIVILDEATASVDPENEHLIQSAISELTKGKTLVTIAHRLATIENVDQILVVDDKIIKQKGTHKELIAQDGTYRRFIEIRKKAEGWTI